MFPQTGEAEIALQKLAVQQARDVGDVPLSRLQQIVQRTPSKAGGLDNITYDMLKAAPAEALQELATLLHMRECEGQWPRQLRLQLVSLLPKKPDVERPITLTSVIYIGFGHLQECQW